MDDRTRNLMFSSSSDEYETPPELFEKLHKVFDFTIDLAASRYNALLPRHYSLKDNAIEQDWIGETGFCNPPYSNIKEFVWKAQYENLRSSQTELVYLIPARTETRYYHDHIWDRADMVCMLKGRLSFWNKTLPAYAITHLVVDFAKTDSEDALLEKCGYLIDAYDLPSDKKRKLAAFAKDMFAKVSANSIDMSIGTDNVVRTLLKPSSAPFPSALVFYGNLTDERVRAFSEFGHVIKRY